MGIGTALLYALTLIVIVFIVLGLLFLCILAFSFVIRKLEAVALAKKPVVAEGPAPAAAPATAAPAAPKMEPTGVWGGQLLLKKVDEPTAAMIMAIVSDQSGIPLSELVFKSISLVDEEDK